MPAHRRNVVGGVVAVSDAMQQHVALFLQTAAARRLSPHTVDSYRRDLQILMESGLAAENIKTVDIRRLVVSETRRGIHPSSIARRLSAWRMFFGDLQRRGIIEVNPAIGVRAPKKNAPLPRALTPDETAHFLDAPTAKKDIWAMRDRALLELLYSSGLRIGEALSLNAPDLDLSSGMVHIKRGKGGRGRVAPLGDTAKTALKQWLAVRPVGGDALFVNHRGGRLSARAAQQKTATRATTLGYAGKISPHVLRHSCASHFLQSSGDLRATQELLGHQNISSTQIYTRLDFQNLARAYDRAHPRAVDKK